MDPFFDNPACLMVFLFVYFVAKATLDPQCENWDVSFDCDPHSLCTNIELHIIGMQVHHDSFKIFCQVWICLRMMTIVGEEWNLFVDKYCIVLL
jgi:hypothetical protein